MDGQTYAVIDATGTVQNIIVWDGTTDYQPPQGCGLQPLPEGVGIGWIMQPDGTWMPPLAPPVDIDPNQ